MASKLEAFRIGTGPPDNTHTTGITPHPTSIKINYFDFEDELKYWELTVICYILGANPLISVIKGFVKRI